MQEPLQVPAQIHAGDTLAFTLSLPRYPASAGWRLEFGLALRGQSSGGLLLAPAAVGDAFLVEASSAVTDQLSPGVHTWSAWVTRPGETYTAGQGQMEVRPNPRNGAGLDPRSPARRTLDDLLAAKARWDVAGGQQRRYRIGEREMEFKSAAEIERQIRFWEWRVHQETSAAAGHPGGRFYLTPR